MPKKFNPFLVGYLDEVGTGGGGGGSGDVVGPSSAVNNNFAAFDLTTGKLIKDSGSSASSFASALGADDNYATDAEKVKLSNLSGTNTGDQTSIAGITGTKAQFNAAVTDGDILYVGDIISYNFVDNETPTGAINDSNVTFTLANTPTTGSLHVVKNGVELYSTDDYTLSGVTLTLSIAPSAAFETNPADKLRANYRYT